MRVVVGEEHAITNMKDQMLVKAGDFTWVPADPDPTAERRVVDWLAQLRLLRGVPFEYLVPDEGLLRPETMRFFHVDRNWTDVLVEGAHVAIRLTPKCGCSGKNRPDGRCTSSHPAPARSRA